MSQNDEAVNYPIQSSNCEEQLRVLDQPGEILFYGLVSMRGRLKLEMAGLRFKPIQGRTTAAHVKKMFGLPKGCRNVKAMAALEAEIEKMKKGKREEIP